MRTAATILSISRSLESLVRRKRSCGVRRGADRKVPARADNSLAAYSTLGSRSFHRSQRTGCAVKHDGGNVFIPWGIQVPLEPLGLSTAGHLAV